MYFFSSFISFFSFLYTLFCIYNQVILCQYRTKSGLDEAIIWAWKNTELVIEIAMMLVGWMNSGLNTR